jgi:secreted trypsin-like serine protease
MVSSSAMTRFAALLILTFLSVQSNAIVGGQFFTAAVTDSDSIKIASHTVVLLNTESQSSHSRCTGTLIAKNVLLTAAHCVDADVSVLWVVTSIYEFSVSERHAVSKIIRHENYNSFARPTDEKENSDIALVQFAGELPAFYQPTTWVSRFNPSLKRFWLPVAGYGESMDGQGDSGELRIGKATVFNFDSSASYFKVDQTSQEGICKGDSGGPAYLKIKDDYFLLGIVSGIDNHSPDGQITSERCFGTSYFNSSLFYQDWIAKNLKSL